MVESSLAGYYTVAQAADYLGVSRLTVSRWIKADRLPAYRVGPRSLRIKREDLDRMIRPHRGSDPSLIEQLQIRRPSAEELARRQALVRQILANREERAIAPLTSVDLIAEVREQEQLAYGQPAKSR